MYGTLHNMSRTLVKGLDKKIYQDIITDTVSEKFIYVCIQITNN